ncbi:MAG: TolC family protein [Candidatus Stygibacter frigidus]|nr:TolC family protein [Candidatus Stygibacter frigidus]
MKIICLLIIVLLPVLLLGTTLTDCLQAAEDNYAANPNQELFEQIQDINTRSLHSKWYPQFNLSANYTGKSESTEINLGTLPFAVNFPKQDKSSYEIALNLQQVIYDGGSISRNLKFADLRSESNMLEVEAGLLQCKTLVTSLYYMMLLAQRQQKILALHKEDLAAELRKLEAGINAGVIDKTSSMLIQDQLWQLADETFKINYQYEECQQKLSKLTALEFTAEDSLENYNSELYIPADINRPELEILDKKQEMELTQTSLSGSGILPQVTANAAYAWGNPGFDIFSDKAHTYYRLGVYFNWQLWDWHSNQHSRKLHSLQAKVIENNRSLKQQAIELQLIEKDSEIQRLRETLKIQSERRDLLTSITASYEAKLEEGIISCDDYLQQFNKQKEIELQQSASELEVAFQRILKIFIMGGEL